MKFKKEITWLVYLTSIVSLFVAFVGVSSSRHSSFTSFQSIQGENIPIYGKGLYQLDSVSAAAQVIAQDWVTLLLGLPLLWFSLHWARRGSIKGRILLAGTIGYFLYTYASYALLLMYNDFFLLYVILLSASFFAFTLTMMSFDYEKLHQSFDAAVPVKTIAGFLFFLAILLLALWLGRILPAIIQDTPPVGLEHYTTLIIQVLDLGFIVPAAILSGVLVLRRKAFGYLLGTILIVKGITMLTAITAMMVNLMRAGETVSIVELSLFPLMNIFVVYCLILMLKHVNEHKSITGGPSHENPHRLRHQTR
ncbi:hypothetical protein [Halobacillus halophilus]|uniref:hypothetical protein n=1 Tax=Halobacillus halophilus TaxID=1570 RepID=UPI001CD637D4|nr:hypothetical protein [Halobacillus halophilus]MCA1011410.1 hypothetical protein [Halobacillus halophilus]